MPNAQLTPCQSSFRCRCARLIRSRKCRDPIGDLAGNEAEDDVEAQVALSVSHPPPLPHDHASCTALALGVDCARVATPQRPLTPAATPTPTPTATATATSTTGNWQRLALALLLIKKFHSPRAFPCHPFPPAIPRPVVHLV